VRGEEEEYDVEYSYSTNDDDDDDFPRRSGRGVGGRDERDEII
jgi:hypothetical protein